MGLEPGISGSQGKRPNHWAKHSSVCSPSFGNVFVVGLGHAPGQFVDLMDLFPANLCSEQQTFLDGKLVVSKRHCACWK